MNQDIKEWKYDSWHVYFKVWMLMYADLDGYNSHKEELFTINRLPDPKVVAEVNRIAKYYKDNGIIYLKEV